MPLAGLLARGKVSGSPSGSEPVRVTPRGVSSSVRSEAASAAGARLTLPTVIRTVALSVRAPSLTWKETGESPIWVKSGVQEKVRVAGLKLAPAGRPEAEKVRGSLSTSVAETVKLSNWSSLVTWGPGTVSTGGSLTGLTVSETVAGALVSEASLTVKVNASEPLKLAAGV